MAKGFGDFVRAGLGVFGEGINTVAQVLQGGDSALRQIDGALQGRPANPPATATAQQRATSEGEVVERVVSLVRQGNQEATQASDAQAPGVVSSFQEAVSTLFQFQLPPSSGDILPSPMDMVRIGLRDLRGSMALVRVANGTGSLNDVAEVANFAEDLVGRVQHVAQGATQTATVEVPQGNPEPPPAPKKRRSAKAKSPEAPSDGTPKAPRQRKKKPSKKEADFAALVAAELGNADVIQAADEYRKGNLTEPEWIANLSATAEEMGLTSLDDILAQAEAKV